MVFWLSFFEVVNPWVPYSFRNYKKRCVPLRLRSSIKISLEICFDWKSEIEDRGQGAIIRQWWSQFPRSFCPTVLHRAGLLLELKRTTLFGGSRKIINCPPIRLLFSFTKFELNYKGYKCETFGCHSLCSISGSCIPISLTPS